MTECEKKYEAIIADLGLTGPRVSSAMIKQMLEGVTYSTQVAPGTTTVVATAFAASGFPLCSVAHHCATPNSFNPALSIEIAITKARGQAWERLRDLEEYRLAQALYEVRQASASLALEQIRTVLGRAGNGLAHSRKVSAEAVEQLKSATASRNPELLRLAREVGEVLGDAAGVLALDLRQGRAAGSCPLWQSCKPVDGVCACQAGKACT